MSATAVDPSQIVLVVEDEPDIRALIVREVGHLGLGCRAASSAQEALRHTGPLDLALIDIRLPETSGVELAHELRRRGPTSKVPIIFVTIVDQIPDAASLDPPATVVHKPFERAHLRQAITAALSTDRSA